MLFWRLQSKIAQIQTVKIFRWSNIPSRRVASFYTSCSVHEKCSNLTGVLGSEGLVRVFYCSSDGSNKKFASGKIHFQFLFMWQEIHQSKCETHVLLFTSISYERKHVSDLSMLVFCFRGHMFVVYLRTTKVHNNSVFKELTPHSTLSTPEIPPVEFPHAFGIPIVNTPPMSSEFHNCEPPPPLQKS